MTTRIFSFPVEVAHLADEAVAVAREFGLAAINPNDPSFGEGASISVNGDDEELQRFEDWITALGASRDER